MTSMTFSRVYKINDRLHRAQSNTSHLNVLIIIIADKTNTIPEYQPNSGDVIDRKLHLLKARCTAKSLATSH